MPHLQQISPQDFKMLREEANLSKESLAMVLGLSVLYIDKVEHGEISIIDIKLVEQWHKACHQSLLTLAFRALSNIYRSFKYKA